ncbi:hypothetical protein GDO81_003577 [Engystomops pustulosus]|uniref:Uncharacterized protein n=1 Tax=Engystomops pustulosus TaxID=76066 RepID=A0AAV6ZXY2_ENGPU|nr:hypothetical protein GDO81_003577 [Engystomops pustulosus]
MNKLSLEAFTFTELQGSPVIRSPLINLLFSILWHNTSKLYCPTCILTRSQMLPVVFLPLIYCFFKFFLKYIYFLKYMVIVRPLSHKLLKIIQPAQ